MLDNMTYWIENADSALLLPTLPAASVDALVTDPPAGIGFMGKEWDGSKGGRDKWIGKMLTVKYQGRTATGSLRFPVGLRLRDEV